MVQASVERDNNAKILFGRAKASIGDDFVKQLVAKYPPAHNDKPLPTDQRKAGRLLRRMFEGKAVVLDGQSFSIGDKEKANFLIKVVLANSRNERFHGGVFPPFRSSSAKLSTYAHAYYLLHISYALLLEVFLYRGYAVITAEEVKATIYNNASMFKMIFSGVK